MTRLQELRRAAREAELDFDAACAAYYRNGSRGSRFDYYRAVDLDRPVPADLREKCDAYLAACREYYTERDGEKGFLTI